MASSTRESAAKTPSIARASPRTKISTPRSKRSTNASSEANRSPSRASSGSVVLGGEVARLVDAAHDHRQHRIGLALLAGDGDAAEPLPVVVDDVPGRRRRARAGRIGAAPRPSRSGPTPRTAPAPGSRRGGSSPARGAPPARRAARRRRAGSPGRSRSTAPRPTRHRSRPRPARTSVAAPPHDSARRQTCYSREHITAQFQRVERSARCVRVARDATNSERRRAPPSHVPPGATGAEGARVRSDLVSPGATDAAAARCSTRHEEAPARGRGLRRGGRSDQWAQPPALAGEPSVLNEEPQAQLLTAFGLLIAKPEPISEST